MKVPTGLSLSQEIFERIEQERGLIARSVYIEKLLRDNWFDKK